MIRFGGHSLQKLKVAGNFCYTQCIPKELLSIFLQSYRKHIQLLMEVIYFQPNSFLPNHHLLVGHQQTAFAQSNCCNAVNELQVISWKFFSDHPLAMADGDNAKSSEWGEPEASKTILHITGKTFNSTVGSHDSIMVLFYTSWCKNCTRFKKVYALCGLMMQKENVPGTLAACDVTDEQELAESQGLVGIPTLKYFRKGAFIRQYMGPKNSQEIVNFMKDPPLTPISEKGFQLQ